MITIATGIDTATPVTADVAARIAEIGHAFVGRYIIPKKYRNRLTLEESQAITSAGLSILCVYETESSRASGGDRYGTEDGETAYACAAELHMPEDTAIYFAVDFDMRSFDVLEAYLRAARKKIGNHPLGVYGSYYVVEGMAQRGVCDYYWQCVAWSGGKVSSHANIYQHTWDKRLAGITVDFNEQYSEAGLWTCKEDDDMVRYQKLSEIPNDYGFRDVVGTLMDAQIIKGDGSDPNGNEDVIDLSHDQVRSLVFEYRGGAFDRKLIAMGMAPVIQT